jgi:capsule polysaccharide export protein KpsE/RkpR
MDISGVMELSGSFGGFAGQESRLSRIARAAGLSLGYSSADIITAILTSRSVMEEVVFDCDIFSNYNIKKDRIEDALEHLGSLTNVQITKEDIVIIECIGKSRALAAKLVNSYIENLDRFLKEKSMSKGKNMRIFVEKRLAEVESELATAAESLKSYQERTKIIIPDAELKAAIEAYAGLRAQLFAKEVQTDIVGKYSSKDAPYYSKSRIEVDAIKKKLSELELKGILKDGFGVGFGVSFAKIPEVMQEYFRRYSDLMIQEEVYAFLKQQYEQARIMEVKDTPIITVLDWGKPPERKYSPRRAKLFMLGLVIGFGLGIIKCIWTTLTADLFRKRERKQLLREIKNTVIGDIRSIVRLLLRREK